MINNNKTKTYSISAKLIPVDIEVIKVYLLGAVNAFCNAKPDEAFSARILFGGNNRNWGNTPMQKLYDYYIKEGKTEEDAHQAAAIDAGRLLKAVLERDSRKFEIVGKDTGTLYKLV
ncbi:hypothetical protein [uncultured Eubacterium sp.]|mgnify:CR=1 FL=1|uniref:hypothetical protein n=1 Tax=uncultured Eubacterium sp. TaxID=165185 RepID=UPI0025EE3700|nr:hypothetical protein [uncultured Eubacterium sp.]